MPPACLGGVRGWALSHTRPPVLGACGRGPLRTGCGCGGRRHGDPLPTPQRALLRAAFARCGGGTRALGGGRLLPGYRVSAVHGALSHARPPVLRASGRGLLPTGCGCGGCGRGDPSPTPEGTLLRADFVRSGGGTKAAPEGASCLRLRRLGSGALSRLIARPWGMPPGPATHWLRVRGVWAWGPVTKPTAGAGFAGCGGGTRAPGGCASCLRVGRPGLGALPRPTARPWGVRPAPATHWLRVRGVWAWGPVTNPTACTGFACCGGGMRAPGGRASCLPAGHPWSASHARPTARPWSMRPGPATHWLWVRCAGFGPGCLWHLLWCRGSSCVVRTSRLCGTRRLSLLGTCPCAVVVAGGVPLWLALSPRAGAPRLVRSGRSQCSGRLSCRSGASLHPGGCRPRRYWAAARGTLRPAGNRALCARHWPLPRQGRWALSASYPFRAPQWGCLWPVPPASVLGCVRCGGLACVDLVTDASGFPYCPSFNGESGWCTRAVWCGRRHLPCRVAGRHARVLCVCSLRALLSWVGQARLPGTSWRAQPFLWPLCPSTLFGLFGARVARASVVCLVSFFRVCSFSPLALPLFLAFSASWPWILLALALLVCSYPPHHPRTPLLFWPLRPSSRLPRVVFSVLSGPGCPGPRRFVSARPYRPLSLSIWFFLCFFFSFAFPLFLAAGRSWWSLPVACALCARAVPPPQRLLVFCCVRCLAVWCRGLLWAVLCGLSRFALFFGALFGWCRAVLCVVVVCCSFWRWLSPVSAASPFFCCCRSVPCCAVLFCAVFCRALSSSALLCGVLCCVLSWCAVSSGFWARRVVWGIPALPPSPLLLPPVAVAGSSVVAPCFVLSSDAVLCWSVVPPVVWCAAVCVVSCWWCPGASFALAGAVC